jgi:GAF domain-containing protein
MPRATFEFTERYEEMPEAIAGRADRTVERLLRQQAALAAFGAFAFRERDLAGVLAEASRICAEGLGAPFCKVCRYRPAEGDLLVEAGFGWNQGVVGGVVSRADATSPQGRAYATGAPVIVRDLRAPGDYRPPPFYAEHGIVSTVDVLIRRHGGSAPWGVLEIDSPAPPRDYDRHDVDFLTGFANVFAEAVATAERAEALAAPPRRRRRCWSPPRTGCWPRRTCSRRNSSTGCATTCNSSTPCSPAC